MNVTTEPGADREARAGDAGDTGDAGEAASELVKLVRATYPAAMPPAGDRGLARLERTLHGRRGTGERPRRARLMLAAALCVLALTVGGGLAYRQFDKVTYEVMNGAVGPGGLVRATAPGTTILFSEGSEITLGESARTRVDGLTGDGGHVVVESGSVRARIVPRKRARWFVDAGPYTIRVTGTAFAVKWSWDEQTLDLRMERGSVIVTGPLAPAGVTLTAGMKLVASPTRGLAIAGGAEAPSSGARERDEAGDALSPDDTSDDSSDDALSPDLAAPSSTAGAGRESAEAVSRVSRHKGVGDAGPAFRGGSDRRMAMAAESTGLAARSNEIAESWDRQLARGNVQAILDDAAARGVDRILVSASGREMSALADAARYGHQPTLARRVLLSVRERFPRSGESRDAAFFLGGLAEDAAGTGGLATALDWYERYLQESPHGRYSAQALGRKMVMTEKLTGADAARPVASEYLDRFPGGPYASAARKLLRPPLP